ncbi:hypothetical protein [Photorhabdus luminescens]|uniref:Uncharacterized protein n=1 Tax=Photorhabdus luminescens subsp. mexicana TaxID=2100167 RepID=A0A4R4ITT8_PHOLU|nr:hypothetical protein [Photorhabdus luminescens]TDB44267.1 hypothetical protein C5468_22355 [Photorhabdus luminescens subsp. mexicana]
MATYRKVHVNKNQLSFLNILEASDREYDVISADMDHSYQLRFSEQLGYELISNSLHIMIAPRSTLEQRIDEILWFFSDVNQENMCSFTNCCLIAGLDPYETHMKIMHRWANELDEQAYLIKIGHYTAPNNMEYVKSQRIGYEKYKKAFYYFYPSEAAKPKQRKLA